MGVHWEQHQEKTRDHWVCRRRRRDSSVSPFPSIRNKEGRWIDSWTWREEIVPLPNTGTIPFGELVVYKPSIRKIKPIEDQHPAESGRCWYCGKRVERWKFCSPEHEVPIRVIGLDEEMLRDDEE